MQETIKFAQLVGAIGGLILAALGLFALTRGSMLAPTLLQWGVGLFVAAVVLRILRGFLFS